MKQKHYSKFISLVIAAMLFLQPFSTVAYAAENPIGNFFANLLGERATEDAGAFTTLEIREGSLAGKVVVNLLSPSGSWSLSTDKDYYVYGVIKKPAGENNLQIRMGNKDGTFNGLTFFNPPGGSYAPGDIIHDYFDKVVSYSTIDDPVYGPTSTAKIALQDGTITYHIKDTVGNNDSITFATGLIVNDAAYVGKGALIEGLQVSVGHMDGGSFVEASSKTSDVNVTPKSAMRAYYSSTALNATLDAPSAYLTTAVGELKADLQVAILYDKVEYDLYFPKNATLLEYGFSSSTNVKTHAAYGKISASAAVAEGDQQKVHITVTGGYKARNSSVTSVMRFDFPSTYFKAGQQCKVFMKNVKVTPQGTTTPIIVPDASTPVVYSLLDGSVDYTTISAMNRPEVYNHTINTSEPYTVSLGSVYLYNKSTSAHSPYEKTYEADFNVTNTAAVVSTITVPLGTNNNPVVTWQGVRADGSAASGTLANPADYAYKKDDIAGSKYLQLFASDLGILSFTSVKAEIGKIRPGYATSGWTSSWEFTNNASGAMGYFTTPEVGIQVKNTYRVYNTDPAQRNLAGGNLTVSSVATSTSQNRIGFNSGAATIKNEGGKVVDSIAAGESVSIAGHVYPYSVPLAVKKGVLTGTNSLIVDPVFYLTLPMGLTYEDLSFTLSEQIYSGSVRPAVPVSPTVENVSYLNTTGDGVSIYKVTFPKGTNIGYYNSSNSRFLMNYTIKLRTSKSMETKRYELNDLIGISAQNNLEAMPYSSNPTTLNTVMPDIYGINGGKDYAGISKGIENSQPGFGLQQLAEINVYNSVSVSKINGQAVKGSWQTYDPSDPNSIASLGKNSEGQFRLNIQNTSNTASGAMELILPIPKKGTDLGDSFTQGAPAFDMSMNIPLAELTAKGFNGKYIKVTGSYDSYDGAVTYTDSDSVNANAILLSASSISAGANENFIFPFTVTNGDADASAIWRNVFKYTTSDNAVSHKTGSFVASSIAGSSIAGVVFEDKNRNGLHEASEMGVPGVTVVVKDSENKILSTITDEAGRYTFLAVRETALDMTCTIPTSQKMRFNIPASEAALGTKVTPSADGTNAVLNFIPTGNTETVNAAVSGFATVSYDKNAASATGNLPPIGEYVSGSSAEISVKPDNLILKGYTFKEWNTSADGKGTGYQPGQTLVVADNVTLYAIWEIGVYNILFDYRGATAGNTISEKELTHNQRYDTGGVLPNPKREGYTFKGWTTTPTGTAAIANTSKFALGEDTTLYAMWAPKNGYTVKYNTNGGNSVADIMVTWEQGVLPTTTPTRMGYTFDGWYYGVDKVTEAMTYGSLAVKETPNITLDAKWTAKAGYTVAYNTDGGTSVPNKTDVAWSDNSLLPTVNPTKTNFAFGGWKLSGTETVVTGVTTYGELAASANVMSVTFDAVWNELANNTVSYVTDGGTFYNDKTNVLPTDSGLIPTTNPVRAGYDFIGWMCVDKTVIWTTKYNEISSNATATLTANWRAKSYTVNYSEGGFTSANKRWSDSGLIAGKTPNKNGNTFEGWYYGNTKLSDATKISQLIPQDNTNVITLTAKWIEDTYTIVYASNGGGNFAPKNSVKYGASNLLPDSTPVRTGYTFAGWKSGGTPVTATTTCGSISNAAVGGVITLTAEWTEKSGFTVNYNSTGGTAVNSKTGVAWTSKALLPQANPTRTGYEFKGWVSGRTAVTAATAYNNIATADTAGSSVTLVAQWSDATGYEVSFNTGSGTPVGNKTNISWNSKNLLPLHDVAPAGFQLIGWTFKNVPVTPSTTYGELATLAGNDPVVLVAVYELITGVSGNGTDVQGKVVEDTESAVYKIDISWGPMTFEYSVNNVWDPVNHSYIEKMQGWTNEPFDGVNNLITAANHSNADVEVSFLAAVEDPEAMAGVDIELRQQNRADGDKAEKMLLSRVPAEAAAAPEISAYLWLIGTPENSSILNSNDYSKFGVINVSIRGIGGALTPKNELP